MSEQRRSLVSGATTAPAGDGLPRDSGPGSEISSPDRMPLSTEDSSSPSSGSAEGEFNDEWQRRQIDKAIDDFRKADRAFSSATEELPASSSRDSGSHRVGLGKETRIVEESAKIAACTDDETVSLNEGRKSRSRRGGSFVDRGMKGEEQERKPYR